jgi:hypothetical protein
MNYSALYGGERGGESMTHALYMPPKEKKDVRCRGIISPDKILRVEAASRPPPKNHFIPVWGNILRCMLDFTTNGYKNICLMALGLMKACKKIKIARINNSTV